MDDKLRSEVMDDIEGFLGSPFAIQVEFGGRLQQVMTDYEHLEIQMLQAKRIIEAMIPMAEFAPAWHRGDTAFAILSHAKAFLEENDG